MIPLGPHDTVVIGGNSRRAVEVAAGGYDICVAGRRVNRYDFVGGFIAIIGVGFSHAEKELAVRCQREVGESHAARDRRAIRQRLDRTVGVLPVDALVYPVGQVDRAVSDGIRSAAVLVHGVAHVEAWRRERVHLTLGVPAHHDDPPALGRSRIEPVDIITVDFDLVEASFSAAD